MLEIGNRPKAELFGTAVAQWLCMSVRDLPTAPGDEEATAVHYGARAREAEREGDFRLALALYMRAILVITRSTDSKTPDPEVDSACTRMLQCD